jgi:hypothetical protein
LRQNKPPNDPFETDAPRLPVFFCEQKIVDARQEHFPGPGDFSKTRKFESHRTPPSEKKTGNGKEATPIDL